MMKLQNQSSVCNLGCPRPRALMSTFTPSENKQHSGPIRQPEGSGIHPCRQPEKKI